MMNREESVFNTQVMLQQNSNDDQAKTATACQPTKPRDCELCGLTSPKLFLLPANSWPLKPFQLETRNLNICGFCLQGRSVPVFRSSLDKWQVGEVKAFYWQKLEHEVEFDDQDTEIVNITMSPFSDYVSKFQFKSEEDTGNKKSACFPKGSDIALNSLSPTRYRPDAEVGDDVVFRRGQFSFEKSKQVKVRNDIVSRF